MPRAAVHHGRRPSCNSFRYADTLGRLAKQGVSVLFHNTLASSEYGLLQSNTFTPRPNYWTALLWRRMMGTVVLEAGPSREGMHLYAHCLRGHPGGVAVLAINNSRTTAGTVHIDGSTERYTLTADALQSKTAKLNGKILALTAGDELPSLVGASEPAGSIRVDPASITFLAAPNAANPHCVAH